MNKKLESALKCVEGENYCPRFYKSECECPYDLARAVKRLTRDRETLKAMSEKGRTWNFTMQMTGGLFDWDSPAPHNFHASIGSYVRSKTAAQKAEKRSKGGGK